MAITNYTDLQTTIADFLNRDDLTTVIPTFIQLAETQFNRDIRHWQMEARTQGTQNAGDEYMQIPADWVETIRMHVTDIATQASSNPTFATRTTMQLARTHLRTLTLTVSSSYIQHHHRA